MKTESTGSNQHGKKTFTSDLSGKSFPLNEKVKGKYVRESIMKIICKEHQQFSADQSLSLTELNRYRQQYIEEVLKDEAGRLSNLDQNVLDKIKNNQVISAGMDESDEAV